MSDERRGSNKSDFQLKLDDGGALARRKTSFLPDGSYLFEDQLDFKGVLTAKVITCSAWLIELYELEAGEIFFITGKGQLRTRTECFGVFYPPFTISQPCFKDIRGRLVGVASTESLLADLTISPTVFETTFKALPESANEAIEILKSGAHAQSIAMSPSLLTLKAKRLIDENYLAYPSIARISARLKVTHEHLSRQFKRDLGMTPSAYLRQLRMADAPLLLARGEEIINVSQDVGYNDLSRFYKQFRKTTRTSPGACQTMMKPKGPPR
jgi:AraC-like DNA-binding protein